MGKRLPGDWCRQRRTSVCFYDYANKYYTNNDDGGGDNDGDDDDDDDDVGWCEVS